MHECCKIADHGRAIHEQLERHRLVFAVIFFNDVPCDKAQGTYDERCKDVGGVPGILLTTPDKADDKNPNTVSAHHQDGMRE